MQLSAIPPEAWRAMSANRLRTALTMLGMIIGVAAVVLMLAIGQGAQESVKESISSMGANLFIVLAGSTSSGGLRAGAGSAQTLTMQDAEAIRKLPTIKGVAPMFPGNAQVVYGGQNWSTPIYGTAYEYLSTRNLIIDAGRAFDENDVRTGARVAILGQTVIDNLFEGEDPLGKTIRIQNTPFTVIGVLAPKGQSLDGRDQDDSIYVPISTAKTKLFGNPFANSVRFITVQARSDDVMDEAQEDIAQVLRIRHRLGPKAEDDFTIRNLTALAESAATSTRVLSIMLGAIASISLLVGGIGIMNIMLVSVTERTREIGIRMAIGAKRHEILLQFLLEAIMMCVAGGLIGAVLGVSGAWLVATYADMPVVVTASGIVLAFAFSAAIGIFFGYYPASKAASLRPVEALRYE